MVKEGNLSSVCFCFNSDARKEKEKKRFNMKIYHYYHFTYHFGNPSPNIFRNINICVIISKSGEDVKTIIQFALTY